MRTFEDRTPGETIMTREESSVLESSIRKNWTCSRAVFEGGLNCEAGDGGIATIKIYGPSDLVSNLVSKVMHFIEHEETGQNNA